VQRTSNIYRLITIPGVYMALGRLLGGEAARQRYIQEVLKPIAGMRVLDCGCGPAALARHLPRVDYTGIDLNAAHIDHARRFWGGRGVFIVGDVTRDLDEQAGSFDLVIVSALLHHLADAEARRLLAQVVRLAKPGGRVVTIDAVWLPGQHPVAWLLNKLDSGLNIRTAEGYVRLTEALPALIDTRTFRNLLRVPYDHFCMILTRRA
jgi:SAM-dependent methyltransferase